MTARLIGVAAMLSSTLALAAAPPEQSAAALARRLLPAAADRFAFEAIAEEGGRDVFELESRGGNVVVRGISALSMAVGLNWYLKYHAHASVSLNGCQSRLPDPLPAVPAKVRQPAWASARYFFNYCTFGDARDARIAVDRGADGLVVSNHGGRQLDGAIAPLRGLPEIVAACPEVPVMLDSGIRRGTDVLKALALGAKFVFLGRSFGYAASVGGEAGVLPRDRDPSRRDRPRHGHDGHQPPRGARPLQSAARDFLSAGTGYA